MPRAQATCCKQCVERDQVAVVTIASGTGHVHDQTAKPRAMCFGRVSLVDRINSLL